MNTKRSQGRTLTVNIFMMYIVCILIIENVLIIIDVFKMTPKTIEFKQAIIELSQ